MGLPNCSRVLVYSATSAMADSTAPAWAKAMAVVDRWTSHSTMEGPSSSEPRSASSPTGVEARVTNASGRPVLVV
jgi:hypothetical protein